MFTGLCGEEKRVANFLCSLWKFSSDSRNIQINWIDLTPLPFNLDLHIGKHYLSDTYLHLYLEL